MCGIFGLISNNRLKISKNEFLGSLNLISHRGPDNEGYKEIHYENINIKFGHRRLSILDLDKRANQPMLSNSGRYLIIYNGEIYNHLELRKKINSLKKLNWKTTCDTETIIEYFDLFGIHKSLDDLEGMFSFCIYDLINKKFFFSRDRAGEKPLYIAINNKALMFASDLGPFNKLSIFNKKIDKTALKQYLKYNYIPSPYSIYKSCFKIPPGELIEIDLDKIQFTENINYNSFLESLKIKSFRWWTPRNILNQNQEKKLNNNEITNKVELCLKKSISNQLISDVPVGAFLSGGIDSTVVATLLNQINSKIKFYTIGYDFDDYDESKYASNIAKHLGLDHEVNICTKKNALEIIPELNNIFQEPFADSSQIPTTLISKIASKYVKVILTGDGGDELFGGYNRYLLANKFWKYYKLLPSPIKNNLSSIFKFFPKDIMLKILKKTNFSNYMSGDINTSYDKLIDKLKSFNDELTFYNSLVQEWNDKYQIIDFSDSKESYELFFDKKYNLKIEESMMLSDFETYLPDDILCKVDRSSMFSSIESRIPFLNKDLINIAFSIPLYDKINHGVSKLPLRNILGKYLPNHLYERKKQGFSVPISKWMRKELKDWVNDILSKNMCDKHNYFYFNTVEKIKNEHLNGQQNHEHKLWSIIQFNSWYENNFQ